MSKRLQVILDDEELLEIQRIAELKQMTVAEWVRQTLRAARKGESTGDPTSKLAAIRAAARHSFPTADVDEMMGQIEAGYAGRK
jgi:hypothetical protein